MPELSLLVELTKAIDSSPDAILFPDSTLYAARANFVLSNF